MRFPTSQIPAVELLLLLLASTANAQLDCTKIVAGDHKFDLGGLKGAHTVLTTDTTPPTVQNTTYTMSICGPIKRAGDVKKEEKCPNGAWICALEHTTAGDKTFLTKVIPIAGNMADAGHGKLQYKATRLSTSDSNEDAKKEGVRLVMDGNKYDGRKQKAIIEFLCDDKLDGTEGEQKPPAGDEYEEQGASKEGEESKERRVKREGEEGDGETDGDKEGEQEGQRQIKNDGAALVWNSYGPAKGEDGDVLRLTWHTKLACESKRDEDAPTESSHWGFFTWFVILVFLGTAAYLIFGSWLNYNRYGARGWDLLPHGDMIRDIPYLMKDWIRRLINTLQGSGSRGGYSAV